MNDRIFRKKSMDQLKSPESLDEYIKVTSPSVWLLLISVIILLAGAYIWSAFGHINSTVPVTVRAENGGAVCFVSEENITAVKSGMTVRFDGEEAVIEKIGEKTERGYVCTLSENPSLTDGFYDGKIVIQSIRPISFIFN